MKAYEVVGYVFEAAIYCPECAPEKTRPVFADSETDSPSHCPHCGALIREALTPDGVEYVRNALREFAVGNGGDKDVLVEWCDRWPEVLDFEPEDFTLIDDGTMDTVIRLPDDREWRYECDTAGDYRDESGALDTEAFVRDIVMEDWRADGSPFGLEW